MKKIRIYLELNQLNFDQEKNNIIKNNNNLSIDHLDQQVKISLQHQPNLFNYLNSVMRQKVNDEIAVFDGINGEFIARIIAVEKKSFLYLAGTILEFSGGLNGKGFVFNNPNAQRTCGCGESFSL